MKVTKKPTGLATKRKLPPPDPRTVTLNSGQKLYNVHLASQCADDKACSIHRPSAHHMREWPQRARHRGGMVLMERFCPDHGVGHPDPDYLSFVKAAFGQKTMEVESVHGCCGCCAPPKKRRTK